MKILIDKKVWDLPDGELTDMRDMVMPYSNKPEFEFEFEVPYGCCTKHLVKYMEDKFNSNAKLKVIALLGDDHEIKFKCKIRNLSTMRGQDTVFKYVCIVLGEVKTRKLINWTRIENEK